MALAAITVAQRGGARARAGHSATRAPRSWPQASTASSCWAWPDGSPTARSDVRRLARARGRDDPGRRWRGSGGQRHRPRCCCAVGAQESINVRGAYLEVLGDALRLRGGAGLGDRDPADRAGTRRCRRVTRDRRDDRAACDLIAPGGRPRCCWSPRPATSTSLSCGSTSSRWTASRTCTTCTSGPSLGHADHERPRRRGGLGDRDGRCARRARPAARCLADHFDVEHSTFQIEPAATSTPRTTSITSPDPGWLESRREAGHPSIGAAARMDREEEAQRSRQHRPEPIGRAWRKQPPPRRLALGRLDLY